MRPQSLGKGNFCTGSTGAKILWTFTTFTKIRWNIFRIYNVQDSQISKYRLSRGPLWCRLQKYFWLAVSSQNSRPEMTSSFSIPGIIYGISKVNNKIFLKRNRRCRTKNSTFHYVTQKAGFTSLEERPTSQRYPVLWRGTI